jgi:hypothetical protein
LTAYFPNEKKQLNISAFMIILLSAEVREKGGSSGFQDQIVPDWKSTCRQASSKFQVPIVELLEI